MKVGVDLVDVPAFEARFTGRDEALAEMFTEAELAYCRGQRRPWRHLAARFAAKEALLKALATGQTGAMTWRDIEVTRDPAGAPALAVSGATGERLRAKGLTASSVSLSHTTTHAVAVVLIIPT
jgi:holo-[acyl-carrier protein] synthase